MSNEVLERFPSGVLYWVDDSFLHIIINDAVDLSLEETINIANAVKNNFDFKVPLIVEKKNSYSLGSGVIPFTRKNGPALYTAIAYVGYNPMASFSNEYTKSSIVTPSLPAETFSSLSDAVLWIKENGLDSKEHPSSPIK